MQSFLVRSIFNNGRLAAPQYPPASCRNPTFRGLPGVPRSRSQTPLATAFREGLKETGYLEGQNVVIEYRWAESRHERLPALAADLVSRQVAVIAATGGEQSAVAAQAATTRIPIVFTAGGDPVRQGLVASLNQPGGNLTGIFFLSAAIESKRLGLLRELVSNAAPIGL